MLLPALVDHADGHEDWIVFVGTSVSVAAICALVAVATRGHRIVMNQRLGFLLVTFVWLTTTLIGALPFYFAPIDVTFAGAFFESMSGLTTTGSTVLSGLDAMPRGILMWRALLNGLGGIGIIGMVLLILPSLRVGGLSLFQLESSDKSEKLLPRVNQLASGVIAIYVALVFACASTYYLLGMTLFDAVTHAMPTIATGGFANYDESLGFFQSDPILVASTIFMVLGALPFVLYIRFFLPRRLQAWYDPQVPLFLAFCVVFSLGIAATRVFLDDVAFGEAVVSSAFNLVSVITTTGFVSEDYTLWSNAAIGIIFVAMFIGGCAGSTAGGFKVSRLIMLFLVVQANFRRLLRPHLIQRLKYGNSEISTQTLETVTIFIFLFFAMLVLGTLALTMIGLDLLTAFSGALTAIGNVGPGFGQIIGPAGNFSTIPDAALWVLSFLMLIGRLEIVTVLILLSPAFWRD